MRIDNTRRSTTTRQFVPPGATTHARAIVRTVGPVVAPPGPPTALPRRPRNILRGMARWIITVVVGIAAVNLLLNRGYLFGARLLGQAHGPFDTQSRIVQVDNFANTLLASMTMDEKLGQLIVPMAPDTSYNADMQTMITQYQIGGFFVTSNGLNRDQLRSFVQQMQAGSRIPMIMSTDFEGDGGWNVLQSALGALPSESKLAATGDTHNAYVKGTEDAALLKSVGINVNFAPVVDVLTNPDNTVLRRRTFGSDPQVVVEYSAAYIDGLTAGGVAGCLKHFPGLGSVAPDPHITLPELDASLAEMKLRELSPYYALLKTNHAPMVMVTHMLVPALDPKVPTSVSPLVINGLLRHDMGYDGIVVSDALFMGGLKPRSVPQAGLEAFEAGTDLLLGAYSAWDVQETVRLLKDALATGQITQKQIDDSVLRILKFKYQWKIIPDAFKLQKTASLQPAVVAEVPLNTRRPGE